MESETLDINETSSLSSTTTTTTTTTWAILGGCLDDVVTCESSISDSADCSVTPKLPLLLARPSLVSVPCEITLVFTQQHEIKQVYVKSTAKVYEIYCATSNQSDNQYLCTVRCGIASTDDQPPNSTSIDSGSTTSTSTSTDADGWVDVKHHTNSSALDSSLFNKQEETCSLPVFQDRFEATAEISDGDPVMSITLRLLSIKSGDQIYIDQVYVFADPLVSPHNHSSVSSLETSSGSAMLSMFIPTLLQMSKSRTPKVQDHTSFTTGEKSMNQDTEHHSTATAVTNAVHAQVLPNNGDFVHQPNHPLQLPNSQNRTPFTYTQNDIPCNNMEQTLNELVSRVNKIEELCLRFEKNMLIPIMNMETRLERVEQHLESFIKNPQFPRTSCVRYSAPEFSCNESESDSICIGGNDCPVTLKSESSKKDYSCPQELCIPTLKSESNVESKSTRASQLLPGLIISAPEFSNIDEDEAITPVEAVIDSPKVIKKPMSIDDALATALAGFVTSALTKPIEHNVSVEEAEIFCGLERSGSTSSSSLSMTLEKQLECTEIVEQVNFSGIEEAAEMLVSSSVHSDEHKLSSVPIDEGNTSSKDAIAIEEHSLAVATIGDEPTEAVDGNNHVLYERGRKMPYNCSVDNHRETEINCSILEFGCTESYQDVNQAFVMDFRDSLPHIDSTSLKNSNYFADGNPNVHPAVLLDIITPPCPAMVDYSVPVLDVKFSSSDNSSAMSSLASLLVDKPDIECDVPCISEDEPSSLNEHCHLVVVEDEESGYPDNSKLLYDDACSSAYMASEIELQDSSYCSNQDTSDSLI